MNELFRKTMANICKRDNIKNADMFTRDVWYAVESYPSNPLNKRVKRARDEYYRELKK